MIKKITLGLIILILVLLAGLVLFFPLDSFVKGKIDKALKPNISLKKIRIGWNSIIAEDVLIKTPAGTTFLKVKHLRLRPYLWRLIRKKLEIKEIELDNPTLYIKRAKNGRWLLPEFKKGNDKKSQIEIIVKSIEVTNGKIVFIDEVKGAKIDFIDTKIQAKRGSLLNPADITIDVSSKVAEGGRISGNSKGNVITNSFKGKLSINNTNIILLAPYMTGINVQKGLLGLDSNFTLDNGYLKAPSKLRLKDLDLKTKDLILGVSAPIVIELLKQKGEISVDFNVWGRLNNLQNDLKDSFKKKIVSETGKSLISPVENVVKGIGDLLLIK